MKLFFWLKLKKLKLFFCEWVFPYLFLQRLVFWLVRRECDNLLHELHTTAHNLKLLKLRVAMDRTSGRSITPKDFQWQEELEEHFHTLLMSISEWSILATSEDMKKIEAKKSNALAYHQSQYAQLSDSGDDDNSGPSDEG